MQLFEQLPTRVFHDARTLREAALGYAGVGMPVFPVQTQGKAPLVAHGVYAATTDPEKIEAWWRRWPQANIGMPMGKPSGCWALDVDPRHGGLASLDQLAPLPSTRTQQTGGGGMHLLYKAGTANPEIHLSNAVRFAGYPGLDIRVDGGYIVVPPSRHPSGQRYCWQNDLPLLPFPASLVERWRAHHSSPPRQGDACRYGAVPHATPRPFPTQRDEREADPAYWLRCALKYGYPGGRHTYAVFLSCHLIDSVGMRREEAEPFVITYAQLVPQGDHPFTVEEALGCLDWAATRSCAGKRG